MHSRDFSSNYNMAETISFNDAQQHFVLSFAPTGAPIRVPLFGAMGRVLAVPVHATLDQPPADQSAMDGYAVHQAEAVPGAHLRVQQRCYAGDVPLGLGRGCATRVFTGSLIPPGADTVVMQEDAREVEACVTFDAPARAGMHIRRRGEEVRSGQKLVEAGVRLQPIYIGLVAAQGIDMLDVYPMLRVGILTTGDELVPVGGPRSASQIYNSNAPMLTALVTGMGAMVVRTVHVGDKEGAISQALRELRTQCDLVLTTGGASVGEKDLVRTALTSLGASFVFAGVSMKPGKPISLARYDHMPVVVLPGNPGAAFTTFTLLVSPLIRRLQGRAECLPPVTRLPIDFASAADNTRERFVRVRLDTSVEHKPMLQVLGQQGAGNMQTLAEASGLSQLAPGRGIARGDAVRYYDFARWLA